MVNHFGRKLATLVIILYAYTVLFFPAIPHLDIYARDKSTLCEDHCWSIVYSAEDREQPEDPSTGSG